MDPFAKTPFAKTPFQKTPSPIPATANAQAILQYHRTEHYYIGVPQTGVKFFAFPFVHVYLHLLAFARVCLHFGTHFRKPEICVCLRLRAFVCVRLRLKTPPFIAPPFAAP